MIPDDERLPRLREQNNRFEDFIKTYEESLRKRITEEPQRYRYGLDQVPDFIERMRTAVLAPGSFVIGDAMKDTCQALGIKPTHKAISEYLRA